MLRSENGASAIIVAAMLVLFIGIAAVAVDLSAGFTERRLDQTAADMAVMGGALEMIITDAANPIQAAVDEAKTLAADNVGNAIPQGEWTACTDTGALAVLSTNSNLSVTNGSPCISFDEGFTRMRVRIPDQSVATTFGRVLGATQLITSAAAEAGIDSPGAGAFPAGVFSSSAVGTQFCLKTGSNSSNSCAGPTTGDFGNFKPWFYKEVAPGNPTSKCTDGNQVDPLSRAMATGLDHYLGLATSSPGNRINGDDCPSFGGPAFPNRVDSGGGYSNTDVTQGLVTGGSWDGTFSGRLAQGPYVNIVSGSGTSGVIDMLGFGIDNRPLWTYIDGAAVDADECGAVATIPDPPSFPWPASYGSFSRTLNSFDDATQLMGECLAAEGSNLLFTEEIKDTPRLAPVPRYWQTTPLGSNSCCYDIKELVPVFVQGVWTSHSAQWTCSGTVTVVSGSYCKHEPGMTGTITHSSAGQRKIDSASAFLLDCFQLPEPTCRSVQLAGGPRTLIFDLELKR